MKAVLIKEYGGTDQLTIGEYPTPAPTRDELLVKVKATALNRADILQREGKYPPPEGASPILGLEMAGVVEEVGKDSSGWRRGDRVCALLPGGGYAQYVTIPARMAIPIPGNLSFEEAAAVPEVFLTAYQALVWLGQIKADHHVLIHAGASGVGTAAIQLGRAYHAIPIITAGSAKKIDFCLQLGAKIAINYQDGEFASHVLEATHNQGVNVIVDYIGAPLWEQNIASAAIDGKIIFLAAMGGAKIPKFSLGPILRKRLRIIGTTLRSRSQEYKIRLTSDFVKDVLPLFANGQIKPIIDKVFPWQQVAEAHQRMERRENIGKIVLMIND